MEGVGAIYLGALDISPFVARVRYTYRGADITLELVNPSDSLSLLLIKYARSDERVPFFYPCLLVAPIWIYSFRTPDSQDRRFRELHKDTTHLVFGGKYDIPF